MRNILPILGLLLFVAAGCNDGAGPDLEPIPDGTVVLTFDDASRSHLETVAPLLKRHGFGATFFVSNAWMSDQRLFLSWEEVAELHKMGFEVGNHSYNHPGLHYRTAGETMPREISLVDEALERVGVPQPVTFGWPASVFGPEALAVLRATDYKFGRRGLHPEYPPGATRAGTLYDPTMHDPLLIPSAGDSNPTWTLSYFKEIVGAARNGRIAVLIFHGVPDLINPALDTSPVRFEAFLDYLDEGDFNVIAMRDLARYVDPDAKVDDPMALRRVPEDE